LPEQSVPSGSWNPGGVTATEPGVGGAEACGAGALQAVSAKQATTSGASIFIDFQAPGGRFEAFI
jgi:hypothetical protein